METFFKEDFIRMRQYWFSKYSNERFEDKKKLYYNIWKAFNDLIDYMDHEYES